MKRKTLAGTRWHSPPAWRFVALLLMSVATSATAAEVFSWSHVCGGLFTRSCADAARAGNPAISSLSRPYVEAPADHSGGINYGAQAAAAGIWGQFSMLAAASGSSDGTYLSLGSATSDAQIWYSDVVTISGGSGAGSIVIPWLVDGTVGLTGSGRGFFGVPFCQIIPAGSASGGLGCSANFVFDDLSKSSPGYSKVWKLVFPFVFSAAPADFALNYKFTTNVGVSAPSGIASSDFLHTGLQQPVQFLDSSGNPMPGVSITSQSGLDYRNPPSAVLLPTSIAKRDANADGYSDIFFQHSAGATYLWLIKGTAAPGMNPLGNFGSSIRVYGLGDVNGDGILDLVLRDPAGNNWLALLTASGSSLAVGSTPSLPAAGLNWAIAGVGDFDGDGKADILWREVAGYNFMFYGYSAGTVKQSGVAGVTNDWKVGAIADFDGDGKDDILWRNINGANYLWFMNGPAVGSQAAVTGLGADWSIAGVGDFDRDGKPDILWRNVNGSVGLWLMNGAAVKQVVNVPGVTPDWRIVGVGDYNGDGYADILWEQTATGTRVIWFLQSGVYQSQVALPGTGDIGWQVVNPVSNR